MVPPWAMRYLPTNLISQQAERYNLDPFLVAAIVWKESRGDSFRCRYEPDYNKNYLVDVHKFAKRNIISRETEKLQQMTSWGLMQVMGGTARWLGFEKAIPKLSTPACGLEYGCKYLSVQKKRYTNMPDLISSYNAGSVRMDDGKYSNQNYVDEVLGYYRELTK